MMNTSRHFVEMQHVHSPHIEADSKGFHWYLYCKHYCTNSDCFWNQFFQKLSLTTEHWIISITILSGEFQCWCRFSSFLVYLYIFPFLYSYFNRSIISDFLFLWGSSSVTITGEGLQILIFLGTHGHWAVRIL